MLVLFPLTAEVPGSLGNRENMKSFFSSLIGDTGSLPLLELGAGTAEDRYGCLRLPVNAQDPSNLPLILRLARAAYGESHTGRVSFSRVGPCVPQLV